MATTERFTEGALVFVWNADRGWQHALIDSLHKVISPQTYPCQLCQLTYGMAGPKTRWAKFLDTTGRPVQSYYRDEFHRTAISEQFPGLELPVVLNYTSEAWCILLSRDEIMKIADLEALIDELKRRSSNRG